MNAKETREIGQILGLNESEIQLIRQFAAARLQAENEAQVANINDPVGRRDATERAAAQFQTRLVNTLNESQMQRYIFLLAESAKKKNTVTTPTGIAEDVARKSDPTLPLETQVSAVNAPQVVSLTAPTETTIASEAVAVGTTTQSKPARRRYQPIGHYHTKYVKRK
jgi:hypothetical protein